MNILKVRELGILTFGGRRRITALPMCHDTLVAGNSRPTALTSKGAGGVQEAQFQRIRSDLGFLRSDLQDFKRWFLEMILSYITVASSIKIVTHSYYTEV